MDKKRSVGVTFFGYLFILSGILGLLCVKNPQQYIRIYGIGILFFSIIISTATLSCGVFILKLNEKARKIAILLCLIGIISTPFYIKPIFKSANSKDYYNKKKQQILEQMKPEYQQKALENLEKGREISKKVLPIFIVLFGVSFLLLELIPVYFFTRPKVKEQFNKEA